MSSGASASHEVAHPPPPVPAGVPRCPVRPSRLANRRPVAGEMATGPTPSASHLSSGNDVQKTAPPETSLG